jgi:hypothetical protein
MVTTLFPSFLQDVRAYEEAEEFWKDRWNQLIQGALGAPAWKTPWLNTTLANGSTCRDGNPIFSAACADRRLGVKIVQLDPSENPAELAFWTDTFGAGTQDEIKVLVIACVLCQRTVEQAVELMRDWVTYGEIRSTN